MYRKAILLATLSLFLTNAVSVDAKPPQCCSESGGCKVKGKGHKAPSAGSMYQITIEQTGGIAATHKTWSLDSSTLKKPEQNKLADLVANTGILQVTDEKKTTAGAADMFFYEFTVACCGKTHKASFDDGTLPAPYRALKDYIGSLKK